MEYKISKLTLIKWYRINYKRLCTEVNKLNRQIEKLAEYQGKLDKKDKVIDLAIKKLNQLGGMYHLKAKDNTYSSRNVETVKMTSEEIKEYFYKKVEEEK